MSIKQRFCVGCRNLYNSEELIKIKIICDRVHINPKVYLDGRSSYLCYKKDCFDNAKKYKRLEKSFKGKIKIFDEVWFLLEEELNNSKKFLKENIEA